MSAPILRRAEGPAISGKNGEGLSEWLWAVGGGRFRKTGPAHNWDQFLSPIDYRLSPKGLPLSPSPNSQPLDRIKDREEDRGEDKRKQHR
jgi:hypothetical protein